MSRVFINEQIGIFKNFFSAFIRLFLSAEGGNIMSATKNPTLRTKIVE